METGTIRGRVGAISQIIMRAVAMEIERANKDLYSVSYVTIFQSIPKLI